MNTITKIQIPRCEIVYGDKTTAIIHLNHYNHIIGQPVMVRYNTADGGTDTITAIGLKTGQGPDCYSITSLGEERYIGGVYELLPDVSSLVHNIQYVAKYNNVWSLVYIDGSGTTRVIDPLQDGDNFYSLSDDHRYYFRNGYLFRDDNSSSVLANKITVFSIGKLSIDLDTAESRVKQEGESFNSPQLDIVVRSESGEDLTADCEFIASDENGNRITASYEDSKLKLYNIEITETTEVTVLAKYTVGDEEPITAIGTIKFYLLPEIIYGERKNAAKTLLWNPELDKLELEYSLQKDRSYLKVPSGWPLFTHIYDINGLDYISDYSITIDGDWRVYEKSDIVTINNFKQTFTR